MQLGKKKSSQFAASVTVHDPTRHEDLSPHPGHHRSSVKSEDPGKDGKKGAKTGAKALFDMKEAADKSDKRLDANKKMAGLEGRGRSQCSHRGAL